MHGVVAGGHPETVEAGAQALRAGGNAVDAAVAAVLASCVVESPLTALGAGGFMLVHTGSEDVLLDFFVAAPGLSGRERGADLDPIQVFFTEDSPQIFNIGPASCAVPGVPAGLARALERFGSMPLEVLAEPAVRLARHGHLVNAQQAFIVKILWPILGATPEIASMYAESGNLPAEGDRLIFPELADAIERLAQEGPEPFYRGEVAAAISDWVGERGGELAREDLDAYHVVEREPIGVAFRGREMITNPPPSSGGILIAFALAVLERAGAAGLEELAAAMEEAQAARDEDFYGGLYEEGFTERFLVEARLEEAGNRVRERRRPGAGESFPGERLGSTTHITAVDSEGWCASVTCSNGSGSGVLVPGTGVHLNNMLGEQDLNPHGYFGVPTARRMPSMMSPTVIVAGAELEAGLGSGGSNRIRSAILQVVLKMIVDGVDADAAVKAPRLHFEDGILQAEPGVDDAALARLAECGFGVVRWPAPNLFFGGVHAVTRDPGTGALAGGGDPRRGGAVAVVD